MALERLLHHPPGRTRHTRALPPLRLRQQDAAPPVEDGYVRFDAVWEEIPRITVPYGYTSDYLDAYATWSGGVARPRGAAGSTTRWRAPSARPRTRRRTCSGSRPTCASGWIVFRGIGEFGSRDFDHYDAAFSEEQRPSRTRGVPANQTVLRAPTRPSATWCVSAASSSCRRATASSTPTSRTSTRSSSTTRRRSSARTWRGLPGPGGVLPGRRAGAARTRARQIRHASRSRPITRRARRSTLYAFYTWEDGDILQNGRQSGSTVNFATNDVFTSNITNKGNSFGAGADFTIVPDKWLGTCGPLPEDRRQQATSRCCRGSRRRSTARTPRSTAASTRAATAAIPEFDDTKLTYVFGSLSYRFAKQWLASLGVGFEDYTIRDSQTGNTLNYMPASFFLEANNRDYQSLDGLPRA